MKQIIKFKQMKSMILLLSSVLITSLSLGQIIEGSYAIKNIENGLLLRPKNASKSDNASIVLYSANNWKCLTWSFNHVEKNAYRLQNLFSDKTFHPQDNNKQNGVALKQVSFNNENSPKWNFKKVDDNKYRIELEETGLFITAQNDDAGVNSIVILKEFTESDTQLWTIYKQAPSY